MTGLDLLVAFACLCPFLAVAILLAEDIREWLGWDREPERERPYDWERA